jgi:hypothetical protein
MRHTDMPGRGSDAEPNDSTSEDVHDQHHPMAPHMYRFNAEQIDTPDAVLGVSDAGRTIGARVGSKVYGKHATHDIFVDFDAKSVIDLVGNADTTDVCTESTRQRVRVNADQRLRTVRRNSGLQVAIRRRVLTLPLAL